MERIIHNITSIIDAVTTGNHTPHQLIDLILGFQILCIVCFFISAFFQWNNVYAGFTTFFLGILISIFIYYTYRILRIEITRISYGIILGGSVMLVFILLQSAIFWSQYSGCIPNKNPSATSTTTSSNGYGVNCTYTAAMESLSTFSVFLFLSYISLIGVMIKYKNDLLGNAPVREGGYSAVSTSVPVSEGYGGAPKFSNPMMFPPNNSGNSNNNTMNHQQR